MTRAQMLLARILVGLGVVALLAAMAVGCLLWTKWGRAQVAASVAEVISQQIAGRIEVDGFDELSLSHVRAHGIKIFAPDGKPAIEAETATIDFDLLALLGGSYGWDRADIKNGKVYVTEDASGKNNMQETFRIPPEPGLKKTANASKEAANAGTESKLDLRNMVTSEITLEISGGSLPSLRLVDLYGIMRVHVPADGNVELRFDAYRGKFSKGLPTGTLLFREVAGQVVPSHKRLLQFEGRGKTEGAPVSFELEIFTEPKKLVKIDARFPELSPAALPTLGVATWSKLSPTLDVSVHFGKD